MRDTQLFKIEILFGAAHFAQRMRGKKRYLLEKAFLNELTGRTYSPEALPRPIPDPGQDFYILDGEQLAAYAAFRKSLR